jgi:hypothetical protein
MRRAGLRPSTRLISGALGSVAISQVIIAARDGEGRRFRDAFQGGACVEN